jgi:hypothetical protein
MSKTEDKGELAPIEPEKRQGPPTDHLTPWQFKPGQSGNPGGRPKVQADFRRKCRELAQKTLDSLELELSRGPAYDEDAKRFAPSQVPEYVNALKFLTQMGGILAPDQLVQIESAYSRLMLQIADSQRLSEQQKQQAISQVDTIHREALGEEDE